jgi:hypothetical protein
MVGRGAKIPTEWLVVGLTYPLCKQVTFKKAHGKPRIRYKKYLDVKFRGRRPVGRPRFRWNDIRKDSSLLLNITAWKRLAGDRDVWR